MDRLTSMAVFVEVTAKGGFAAAAASLDISPTMVGKHIRFLEARLGARLINRTTRRQGLTEVGRVYLERCLDVLRSVEAADASAEALRLTPRGELRITAPMSLGAHLVAPALLEFLNLYPEVKVDLELTDRTVDLVEDGAEAAFRIGGIGDENLVARDLLPYRMVVCAAPAYLAARPPLETPEDMLQHDCLSFSRWSRSSEWRLLRDGEEHRVATTSRYKINNGEALRQAARAGLGVVMLPLALVAEDLSSGRLTRVMRGFEPPSRQVRLLYLPDRRPTPKLRAFIDFAVRRMPEMERALGVAPPSTTSVA